MSAVQPQTIAENLFEKINDFQSEITHTNSYNKVVFSGLMEQATDLQGKGRQVVRGCLFRASLYSMTGQFELAEKMFKNVEDNRGNGQARIGRFHHLVNHGFATEAMKLADQLFANREDYNFAQIAVFVMCAGGFSKVAEKLEQSIRSEEVLKMTSTVLQLAEPSSKVLTLLGVSDAKIAAMLDFAGEILRANNLFWQGDAPDIRVLMPEDGGPALMFDYRVFVSPQESACMNWKLTEALVGNDLDVPGVHIGFIGTDLPVRIAA